MAVTRDDVRHVASLARLGISDSALDAYVEQLNGILAHIDALARADTSGVVAEEVAGMPLRADRLDAVPLARPIAKFAPLVRDGFLLVPRLATHEDTGEDA